jgi:hypothetical protein
MEINIVEFEKSVPFKISAIALGIVSIIFYFCHVIQLNYINKNKHGLEKILPDTSCLCIFFQLMVCSLFFCFLFKLRIKNTDFLTISNLIGVLLSLEWLSIYVYYNFKESKISLLKIIIPLLITLGIFLFFFLFGPLNKITEIILKNLAFVFYVLMFISPGINCFKVISKGEPKYISIANPIIGIFVNIAMILFLISLYHYNIMDIYFIVYICIALAICVFEITYYFMKINKNNYKIGENMDDINPSFNDYSSRNNNENRKISLISRKSIEED